MRDFAYTKADSLDDAISAVASGARPIAGGTELLNWMRLGADDPDLIIDITRLENLNGIAIEDGVIRIGSLTTLNQIEDSDIVREMAPALAEACLKSASAQIRNTATLGGNVLQKTRCPYFRVEAGNENRLPWPCNKRKAGSGCSAQSGLHDRASLMGTTDSCLCNQPSDPAVALAALNAVVHVVGPNGARDLPMSAFHLSQADARDLIESGQAGDLMEQDQVSVKGADALLVNRLRSDEIIVAYSVPVDAAAANSRYLKVRERESYEYAKVSAAVCLETDGDVIRSVRIAVGSIAQKPWRIPQTEQALVGADLEAQVLDQVLATEFSEANPAPHQEYKIKLARNAVRRAVLMAGGKIDG